MRQFFRFIFGSPQRTLVTLSVCAVFVLIEYRHPGLIGNLTGRLTASVLFAILNAVTNVVNAVLPIIFNGILPIVILAIGAKMLWKKL